MSGDGFEGLEVAQEFAESAQAAVARLADGSTADERLEALTGLYGDLVAASVMAIGRLETRINDLEARLSQ